MQSSDIPLKLPIPFANGATSGYVRDIPVASQIGVHDGYASLTDGFPPLTATPIGSGGVPPDVRDMNGILREVSAWSRWVAAGGVAFYDSAFSTAISGYPKWAMLASSAIAGVYWISTTENNATNPDGGSPAGWVRSDNASLLNGQAASYYTNIIARLGYTPLNQTAYTAADVLTKLLSVDGAGSGLDADLLDGNHAAAFVLASAYTAADVLNKIKTVDGAGSGLDADVLKTYSWDSGQNVSFGIGIFQTPNVGTSGGIKLGLNPGSGRAFMQITSPDTVTQYGWVSWDTSGSMIASGDIYARGATGAALVWNAANDGAGSGLDADVLRGYGWNSGQNVDFGQGSFQSPGSATTGGIRLKTDSTSGYAYFQIVNSAISQQYSWARWDTSGNMTVSGGLYVNGGNVVWSSGNDGAGSGLDADMLDGLDSSAFNRITTSFLAENGGVRIHSDGFKECWGYVDIPGHNSTAFISLPTAFSSWFNVSLGAFNGSDDVSVGIQSKDQTSYFILQNFENSTQRCNWSVRGV